MKYGKSAFKLVIEFLLYNTILNSYIDNKFIKKFNQNKPNEERKLTDYGFNLPSYIDEINYYLNKNYKCKLLLLNMNISINGNVETNKIFNFLEIKLPNDEKYFYIYNPDYNDKINRINSCKIQNINNISVPINFTDEYLGSYLNFFINQKIMNVFNKVEKDNICLKESINKDLELCNKSCIFDGIDITKYEIKCSCPIYDDINKESLFKQIKYYLINFGNFHVLKCIKFSFNAKVFQYNYANEIIIFLIIINLISIIFMLFYICSKKYYKYVEYYKNFIGKQTFDFSKIQKLNSLNLKLEHLTSRQNQIIEELCKYKILNNYNKGKNNKLNIIENVSIINSDNKSEERTLNNNNIVKKEIIKKINKEELDDYYNCIIYFFPKEKYSKYISDDELFDLDIKKYNVIEKLDFFEIFWIIYKCSYEFLNLFIISFNKDYKIYQIKIINYINYLILSIVINISFYNDKILHQIYIKNQHYNVLNRLTIIILTNFISNFIHSISYNYFDNYNFIDLKINMEDENSKENMAKNTYKYFVRKIIICCILTFFIDMIFWYYISCFFTVYSKTQISIFLDFIFGIIINFITTLFISLFYCLIKIIDIKYKTGIFKIMNFLYLIIFFFFQIIISSIIGKI